MLRVIQLKSGTVATLLLAAAVGHTVAAEAPADNDAETPLVTTPYETVDTAHEQVSGAIEVVAKSVDRFFAEERSFEEENESTVQISFDALWRESHDVRFDGQVRAKVVLPGMKRRFLVLESDPREAASGSPQADPLAPEDNASDYTLGLERVLERSNWQIRPSAGLRFSMPLDPYVRLRAIRYYDLDRWLARVSSTASWFNSDGIGLSADVGFDRPIAEDLLFRSATAAEWTKDPELTSAGQMFSLYQRLASRAQLAYDLGATFDNDPNWRATDYYARLRYRRLIYKSWAFLEVRPRIGWPEENDHRKELSLLVRLEVNFGHRYRE